jgi:hypothetical protein
LEQRSSPVRFPGSLVPRLFRSALPVPTAARRLRRAALAAIGLAIAVTGLAALLQWFWAGWSSYGPGPSPAMRWLLTDAVGAALLLPPGAALAGAAVGRRIASPAFRDQVRATLAGAWQLARQAGVWALAVPLLSVLGSGTGWVLVSWGTPEGSGLPGAMAIGAAHLVAGVVAGAFALWALALSVSTTAVSGTQRMNSRLQRREVRLRGLTGQTAKADFASTHCVGTWLPWFQPPGAKLGRILPGSLARSGLWAPPLLALLVAGPALIGPLLPRLARPERALTGVLVVNPVTAVGAALGMDVLRSPRVYGWTRAPEYWYTYPPTGFVIALFGGTAALGLRSLRRRLESE